MEKSTIEEIERLNKEVKKIVEEDSPDNIKIETHDDFEWDVFRHNFSIGDLKEVLLKGLHLEDKHLYPKNKDKKHKGKNYYCIYQHKLFSILIEINYIIISYFKKPAHITLFHISMLNYGSEEQRRYKEIKKIIEPYP